MSRTKTTNIRVHRYSNNPHWQGWIEPDDKSWIAFITTQGQPVFFLSRDPKTGGVIV